MPLGPGADVLDVPERASVISAWVTGLRVRGGRGGGSSGWEGGIGGGAVGQKRAWKAVVMAVWSPDRPDAVWMGGMMLDFRP